jgi:hypothetical protein
MSRLGILFLFFFLAVSAFAQENGGVQSEGRYSSEELETLSAKSKTVAEVVSQIPYFLRKNLTIVPESKSVQESHLVWTGPNGTSFSGVSTPRVILWDTQGTFFLAFNGEPIAGGYGTLESMEYGNDAFKFASLNPDPKHFSTDTCSHCHGDNSRPIWGEYPRWDSYGSFEDMVSGDEEKNLASFRASAPSSDLYRTIFPEDAWVNYPFKKDHTIVVGSESHTFKYRPNTRMSILLNRLNAKRIFAILSKNARYSGDREKLAFYFLGCDESRAGFDLLNNYEIYARDLDIRSVYNDPMYDKLDFTDSYFDGASTQIELLAARVLQDLLISKPELTEFVRFRSLTKMYSYGHNRRLDGEFLRAADDLGLWVRTPFPKWQLKAKKRPAANSFETENVQKLCKALSN